MYFPSATRETQRKQDAYTRSRVQQNELVWYNNNNNNIHVYAHPAWNGSLPFKHDEFKIAKSRYTTQI